MASISGRGREILARAGLHLACVALQQTLVDGTLDVDIWPIHVSASIRLDKALQPGRVADFALGLQEQGADDIVAPAECLQQALVVPFQRFAGSGRARWPSWYSSGRAEGSPRSSCAHHPS